MTKLGLGKGARRTMATLYEVFDALLELVEGLWLMNLFILFVTTASLDVLFYFNVAGLAAMVLRSISLMVGARKGEGGDDDTKLLAAV
jgi:hypothetical protein